MPRSLISLRVSAALGITLVAQSAAKSEEQLVARAPTGVTAEAEKFLAASAKPWRVRIREGEDLVGAARYFCGRLTPDYTSLLLEANRTPTDDGKVTIPACFVFRKNVAIEVGEEESLADVARRSVGIAGPKTLRGIIAANASSFPRNIDPGAHLSAYAGNLEDFRIPLATEAVAYELKAGLEASEVRDKLKDKLHLPIGTMDGPDTLKELKLESSVEPGSGRAVPCATALAGKFTSWPYRLDDVTGALKRIDAVRAQSGMEPMATAKIAVVDNGMDRIFDADFPAQDFVLNDREYRGAQGDDSDNNEWTDDIVGTNVYLEGQPVAFAGAKDPFHGTYMASLALGGTAYRNWQKTNYPARRVKIIVVSLVNRTTVARIGGPETIYTMPVDGLEKALPYVLARGIDTINLSISADKRLRNIQEALFNHDALMLVVAAGNDAYELNSRARYPASESPVQREYGGRVVTVAAHDKNGCLTSFSGRGDAVVDLAAPGVQIEGIGLGGQTIIDEGTSQATALTSFTAALIRAALPLPPASVKDRLHASVDLTPDLAPYVKSGGALNIGKALSLFDDVLELKGTAGAMLGKLEAERVAETFCPELDEDDRVVLKVSQRSDGGDTTKIRLLLRNDANKGVLDTVNCTPSPSAFNFVLLDGRRVRFTLSQLSDFVPAV